jgi:hypothetical protein
MTCRHERDDVQAHVGRAESGKSGRLRHLVVQCRQVSSHANLHSMEKAGTRRSRLASQNLGSALWITSHTIPSCSCIRTRSFNLQSLCSPAEAPAGHPSNCQHPLPQSSPPSHFTFTSPSGGLVQGVCIRFSCSYSEIIKTWNQGFQQSISIADYFHSYFQFSIRLNLHP